MPSIACQIVQFRLSNSAVSKLDTRVVLGGTEVAYSVADVGIETRMVAASIARKLRARGVDLIVDAQVRRTGDNMLEVRAGESVRRINYRFLVVAAGYGTAEATQDLGLEAVRVRLWRSHLATLPRVAVMSVFGIQPHQAAMMNHGKWSIVGLNEDAVVVDEPSFEADPVKARELLDAVAQRYSRADLEQAHVRACVKVDYAASAADPRSLNVRVLRVESDTAVVLPGKMTEAPVVADAAAQVVFGALGSSDITDRPHDRLFQEMQHA